MAFWSKKSDAPAKGPILVVEGLDVYYGRAHALQGVSLLIEHGVFGIVGRNGMGKTTLCNAITGLVPATGSVRLHGEELLGKSPNQITRLGIAYVPQGRRVWPSLTVDETLRLVAPNKRDVERVYTMFPRLAERKGNGGAQLSGGEQQMLAIGRALLLQPKLLVMDEPTEGLAPVIVEQVAQALRDLAAEGEIAVLLIEQNLGVAIEVADTIGVMVNGRIAEQMPAAQLAADRDLQERLLGVRSGGHDEEPEAEASTAPPAAPAPPTQVLTVRRSHGDGAPSLDDLSARTVRGFTRWNAADATAPVPDRPRDAAAPSPSPPSVRSPVRGPASEGARVVEFPVAASAARAAYVVGTFDTKSRELMFLRQCLDKLGMRVVTVDLSTSGKPSPASVHPREVARHHPGGESAVFTSDRGSAVSAHGAGLRALRADAARPGRHHLRRRLGRHHAGHRRHARPAHRPAQGHGLDHGQRRHPPLRRPQRHLHDVFGDRRAGHPPHQREGAGQCRARAGRHDRAPGAGKRRHPADHRPDHVRRDHGLRAGRRQAPGRRSTTAWSSMPPAWAASRWKSWPTPACWPA